MKPQHKSTIVLLILFIFASAFFGKKAIAYIQKELLSKNKIVISYSTDNNYVYPMLVSIHSVMKSANPSTLCKFVILISNDVTDINKEKILSIEKDYKNCKVKVINMGQEFENSQTKSWSKTMYYRLHLPKLLPNVDKCIYLDCDTLIRHDLSEMAKINMGNYYIAGVKDFNEQIQQGATAHSDLIGIPNLDSYICSGVLIMNLKKMREDNIVNKLQDLISENDKTSKYRFPDQDALNVACYGHILILPFKYGAMTYLNLNETYEESIYAKWVYSKETWDQGRTDPVIVHYTYGKPWVTVISKFHQQWWDIVDTLSIKDEIYDKYKK